MPLLFAVTLFVSASLLFMVQPMVGKMILPLLGGSPAVWNACMVFFQALLLLGYLYAHKVTTKFRTPKQWAIHTAVLGVPIVLMAVAALLSERHTPIAIVEWLAPTGDASSPFLSVMALMTVAIGIPFFVISTSAPLLQKWFAYTGHPSARDPYFLYAASNAGSLISLLGYPLFIEPYLSPVGQAWMWAVGFAALAGLIVVSGKAAANPVAVPPPVTKLPSVKGKSHDGKPEATPPPDATTETAPSGWRKAKWVALAFVPSSLMLGVTFHMTTDIASIPLLWVGPLALYLLTFIIAFSTILPPWFRLVVGNLAPVMILLLVFVILSGATGSQVGLTLMLHLATFFAAALMCHYELARDRPGTAHLTEYFLLMSLGGVLGGLFNALFAPLVFNQDYEYKLALIFACFLVPNLTSGTKEAQELGLPKEGAVALDTAMGAGLNPFVYLVRLFLRKLDSRQRVALALDFLIPILVGVGFWGLLQLGKADWFLHACTRVATNIGLPIETILMVVLFAVPVMLCFFFVDRPIRFGLCVAVLLGMDEYREYDRGLIYSERSFFGILKIEENERGWHRERRLVHGTTLHGTQIVEKYVMPHDVPVAFGVGTPWDTLVTQAALDSYDPRQEPLTYYHRTGPVGAMFHELRTRKGGADAKAHVAMVGLGTGSVSCYALPGQKLTFYEIDPAVKRLVADTDRFFTYVKDAERRGATLDFRMGDARLKLKEDTDRKYSLLLVDAFSSDSIPVHLLTREAVQLYFDRMPEDGLLALHISNKFVRLEPVVARIAADLNLAARVWNDDAEGKPGKTASSWVVLAKKTEYLGGLAAPVPDQIAKFVDSSHPLLAMYRRHGGEANLMQKIKEEHGERAELIIELIRQRYGMGTPLKWLLKYETTSLAKLVLTLKGKYGGQAHLRTVIDKKADEKVESLLPLLSHGESLTLDQAWDHVGGKRIDLLREWIARYAAADPDPPEQEDPAKPVEQKVGVGLGAPLLFEFRMGFAELALVAARFPATVTLEDALRIQHGQMFRELQLLDNVPTWTDDYSDVLRVMMIPELQKVRKLFGLPTPVER